MDNFMDKIAQRLSAQEVIKANSEAEAAQMKKLQLQVAEYERILQEMRKLNYKNVELSDKIDTLIGENTSKIRELQADELKVLAALRDVTEEQTRNQEQQLAWEKQESENASRLDMLHIEELLKQSDEFAHKENVKVYRNVQAVVVDELRKQTEELSDENRELRSKLDLVSVLAAFAFVAAIANVILQILSTLQIL